MVKIENLSKTFTTKDGKLIQALENINLDIAEGEIFGIIGRSGAGKSTLVRCINMLEKPTSGRVIIDGRDLTTYSDRQLRRARQQIGMIFQQFNLFSARNVAGNVAFPLEIAGQPRRVIQEKVKRSLALVGLSDKAGHYPAELSGGQKQRVGIARALASEPRLLLCDEPTSALDPQTTASILGLLRDINKSLGLTIIIITHEMQVIKEICDRVAVLNHGRIVEAGSVLDIFTAPRHPVTRELIKSILDTSIPEQVLAGYNPAGTSLLVRLSFIGHSAGEPVISRMIQEYNVQANILYGKIDHIKDTPFGTLTLELSGQPDALNAAVAFLHGKQLSIEVLERQ
ncbi:methionine ABC transporter ATP-binding protein [Neomoorella thermoacetica]|uniref:methionine ABC transporter ATP-binding protein n=1 Tax=Neomoorella thermoacetica TaxID=1525 RepID=UPI0008FB52C2|nr:methionine ABC transporter ATP-binding protein [Moorella thermoacetica]APC09236.1 methionine import ATP-binding protein MetN [Moorella thermoacetica]